MPFQPKPRGERRCEAILVAVTPEVREKVERVCEREGVSLAEVGRRALDHFLQEMETGNGNSGAGG